MLNDRVVLVTGAAGRIGAAVAHGVISHGGRAVLVDVNSSGLTRLEKDLGCENVLAVHADAGSPEEADKCIQESVAHFGKVDAAVHSAYPRSSGWGARFENLEPGFLAEDLSNQLGGSIIFSQRILEYFKETGAGNLVHVSSIQGVAAPKFEHYYGTEMVSPIEYSAIKSAVIAVTRYLAKYYKGKNIRVNCVSPGGILDDQPESFLSQYRESCNSKGMLDAEDVVGTVLYLISDYSNYVTGQNIIVDDGWCL